MNTPAVNSPASLLQAATPNAGKQDTGSTSEAGSFNQVLSREMSGNAAGTNTSNSASNNASSSNDVSKPAQKDGNSKDSTRNESTGNEQNTAATDVGKKAGDDKIATGKDVRKDDKEAAETDAGDAVNIAAFVAALTSANTAPAETAAAATTAATPKVVLTAAEIKAKNDTIDIASRIPGVQTTAGDKDAIGKKADFVAALDKATGSAADNAKASSASIRPDAGVVAATSTQVIKVLDAAIGNTPQTMIAAAATAPVQARNDAQTANTSALLPPVGSSGWDQALGQKVVWMAQGAQQSATLTLNPPDLGPLQVTLNITHNQATASFIAHQPEVRQALEASMPRLREMLNDAGIQLGQSNVSAGSPNQQGAFSEQRQDGRPSGAALNNVEPVIHVSHVPTPAGGNGMVDTFA